MSRRCGILDWGVALPRRRLENRLTAEAWDRAAPAGSRRIAAHDEDAITLGVEAALQATQGDGPTPDTDATSAIDAVMLATTTAPFAEGTCAGVIADCLDLGTDVRCIDMNTTRRSGTNALAVACDMVRAGAARHVLVVAADICVSRPGDPGEYLTGHGGAALLVGPHKEAKVEILAQTECRHSHCDIWRVADSRFARSGDPRFDKIVAYAPSMRSALQSLLHSADWSPQDVRRAALYSPDARSGAALLKKSGFDVSSQYCDRVSARVGLTGAAHALLMLIAAIEVSERYDRIIALDYGNGAAAFGLEILKDPGVSRFDASIACGYDISYNRYLSLHRLHAGADAEDPTFASEMMDERCKRLWRARVARRCLGCRTVLTLPLPTCPRCSKPTDFTEQRLQRHGTVFAVTHEHYVPTPEPPLGMAVVDLAGGGRLTLQVADEDTPLRIDDRVELVFRRLHGGGGRPNYFWKCRSLSVSGGSVQ
ncbi:MAG: OB-fold domain-containing protein [Phycisphaerae bacterium]